ncbi:hypothetical protein D3C85_801830 [compost metagenome]
MVLAKLAPASLTFAPVCSKVNLAPVTFSLALAKLAFAVKNAALAESNSEAEITFLLKSSTLRL